jgi:hypothetical protein
LLRHLPLVWVKEQVLALVKEQVLALVKELVKELELQLLVPELKLAQQPVRQVQMLRLRHRQ